MASKVMKSDVVESDVVGSDVVSNGVVRSMGRWGVCCLLGISLLVAYSGVAPASPGTARFSEASEDEIARVLTSVYTPVNALEAEMAAAILDSLGSRGQCPRVVLSEDRQTIRGDGCVAGSGNRYDGVLEISAVDGGRDDASEAVFRRYRRTTPAGVELYYDGVITTHGDDGRTEWLDADLVATVDGRRVEIEESLSCTWRGWESTCELARGSGVEIQEFGSFEAEGSMSLLSPRGTTVFRGAETLEARHGDDGCVRYRVDGGAEQTWCASGDGGFAPELPPELPIPGFPMPDLGLPF